MLVQSSGGVLPPTGEVDMFGLLVVVGEHGEVTDALGLIPVLVTAALVDVPAAGVLVDVPPTWLLLVPT